MTGNDKLLKTGAFIYLFGTLVSFCLTFFPDCVRLLKPSFCLAIFLSISRLQSTFKQTEHQPGLDLAQKIKFWGKREQIKVLVEAMPCVYIQSS